MPSSQFLSQNLFSEELRMPFSRYIWTLLWYIWYIRYIWQLLCFLTLFPQKTHSGQTFCPKHPNSSARPCFDGGHCEYTQVLKCSKIIGRPGIRSLMVVFHPVLLPLPSPSVVAVTCDPVHEFQANHSFVSLRNQRKELRNYKIFKTMKVFNWVWEHLNFSLYFYL